MRNLRLQLDGGNISGTGRDIVGRFTFTGTISDQGQVAMVKQYAGRHAVDYTGQYDGEGLLWGQWHIGPITDRWMIKIARATSSEAANNEIAELDGTSQP